MSKICFGAKIQRWKRNRLVTKSIQEQSIIFSILNAFGRSLPPTVRTIIKITDCVSQENLNRSARKKTTRPYIEIELVPSYTKNKKLVNGAIFHGHVQIFIETKTQNETNPLGTKEMHHQRTLSTAEQISSTENRSRTKKIAPKSLRKSKHKGK